MTVQIKLGLPGVDVCAIVISKGFVNLGEWKPLRGTRACDLLWETQIVALYIYRYVINKGYLVRIDISPPVLLIKKLVQTLPCRSKRIVVVPFASSGHPCSPQARDRSCSGMSLFFAQGRRRSHMKPLPQGHVLPSMQENYSFYTLVMVGPFKVIF